MGPKVRGGGGRVGGPNLENVGAKGWGLKGEGSDGAGGGPKLRAWDPFPWIWEFQ